MTTTQRRDTWAQFWTEAYLNRIYIPHVHEIWMCYLIYARLPINAQRLDNALLPMFLGKLADLALRDACSQAAGGRFSKSVVGLYGYVGMIPGVQLLTEGNTTHMSYSDPSTLALALPKRQLALQKSTARRRSLTNS